MSSPHRIGVTILIVLGSVFFIEGLYSAYLLTPWAEAYETDLNDVLLTVSFLGIPMGLLCFSIAFVWVRRKDQSRAAHLGQLGFCLFLHVVNFAVAIHSPWGELTRYGGGAIAILFSVLNLRQAMGASAIPPESVGHS